MEFEFFEESFKQVHTFGFLSGVGILTRGRVNVIDGHKHV